MITIEIIRKDKFEEYNRIPKYYENSPREYNIIISMKILMTCFEKIKIVLFTLFLLFLSCSTQRNISMQYKNQPPGIVLERIVERIGELGARYPSMVAFSKKENWNGHFITYSFGIKKVKDPDFKRKEKEFKERLKTDPRPSTWIARNWPNEYFNVFSDDGIDICIRIDNENEAPVQILTPPDLIIGPYHFTIIDIQGPDTGEFQKLKYEIRSIIRDEISLYKQENHQ